MKSKIIIISSPSGAGKTTICKYLIKKIKNIEISTSYTTRPKRKIEKNGVDYYFITKNEFNKLKKQNYFIETAKVFGFFYGSPYININNAFKRNNHIIFDIDWQGAKKLRKKFSDNDIIDIFILPPNKRELRKRLEQRGRDNKTEIKKRLSLAVNEISHYDEYKYAIVNDNITKTVNYIIKIIEFEEILNQINKKVKFANIH